MPLPDAYTQHAAQYFNDYESRAVPALHEALRRTFHPGMRVLEVGCGSGRDARMLARHGCRVWATDGSPALVDLAGNVSSPAGLAFGVWQLPASDQRATHFPFAGEPPFDGLLANAVLQHLSDTELTRAAFDLADRLKDGGRLFVTVPTDRRFDDIDGFNRCATAYAGAFERAGFRITDQTTRAGTDRLGRPVTWARLVGRLDRRAAEGVRTFGRIIETDRKTTTYKLALLRAVCHANRTMGTAVRFSGTRALIPAGPLIEAWIGYYWQLAAGARMPAQINGGRALGFGADLEALIRCFKGSWSLCKNTMDTAFDGDTKTRVTALFAAVATALKKGPVTYIQDEAGHPVFTLDGARPSAMRAAADRRGLLAACGTLSLPASLWFELNRSAPWVEDAVLIEWARVSARMEALSKTGTPYNTAEILARLLPPDTDRDVHTARLLYQDCLKTGGTLRCAWSGRALRTSTLAVDHMLPWARFHNNDLWNLVPSHRQVNGQKSDKIASLDRLYAARDGIINAWQYTRQCRPVLFAAQAEIALLNRALPANHWETPLFDALLTTSENAARQLQAPRF